MELSQRDQTLCQVALLQMEKERHSHRLADNYSRKGLHLDKMFMYNFVFDGEKCSRDSGFILDSVRRDMATNSTWNSQFMGLGYRTGSVGANKVIDDQLVETVAAINYLKAQVAADPSVTGVALTRTNQHFDKIIDIMQNGSANIGTKQC